MMATVGLCDACSRTSMSVAPGVPLRERLVYRPARPRVYAVPIVMRTTDRLRIRRCERHGHFCVAAQTVRVCDTNCYASQNGLTRYSLARLGTERYLRDGCILTHDRDVCAQTERQRELGGAVNLDAGSALVAADQPGENNAIRSRHSQIFGVERQGER